MFLYKGHSGLATIYISWMVAETKFSCKICNVRKDSAVSYLRLRIQISEITNFFRHYFLSRTEVVLCAKQEIRQTQETARREKAEATKGKLYDY